jgi:short-subunit dehydrogenase
MNSMQDRVALVTGSSRGIGAAIATSWPNTEPVLGGLINGYERAA